MLSEGSMNLQNYSTYTHDFELLRDYIVALGMVVVVVRMIGASICDALCIDLEKSRYGSQLSPHILKVTLICVVKPYKPHLINPFSFTSAKKIVALFLSCSLVSQK